MTLTAGLRPPRGVSLITEFGPMRLWRVAVVGSERGSRCCGASRGAWLALGLGQAQAAAFAALGQTVPEATAPTIETGGAGILGLYSGGTLAAGEAGGSLDERGDQGEQEHRSLRLGARSAFAVVAGADATARLRP